MMCVPNWQTHACDLETGLDYCIIVVISLNWSRVREKINNKKAIFSNKLRIILFSTREPVMSQRVAEEMRSGRLATRKNKIIQRSAIFCLPVSTKHAF